MLKPFKFLVQAIVVQEDEDGTIVAEHTSERPNVLYGVEALRAFADGFEEQLAAQGVLLAEVEPE